jgi:CelD/BcsL family acetyltransferase involved in cellulose biosynthesis
LLTIETISDPENFRALRDEWNTLAHDAGASVFQTWQWSWHWWRVYGRGKKLLIIVARDNAKLVALAPLYAVASYLGLPLKVVSFLGTEHADYLDMLVEPGRDDALTRIVEHLFTLPKWDAVDLHQLPAQSRLIEPAKVLADGADLPCDVLEHDTAYACALPVTWEEFIAGLSKKFRWNVQYYRRRLERDHDFLIREGGCNSVKADMALFFKLHQKRFLEKKKPGAYLNPKFRRFHTELAADLCEAGWLRLYVLELDGKDIAVLYAFSFGGSLYYYLGGFEPQWGGLSVSTVLIAQSIQEAIAQGLTNYDFLRGDEPYKQKWRAAPARNHRIIIRRPGKKAGLAKKMLALENSLAKQAKELAQRV